MGDSASEIREEIAETRERLAETAGAVAYKADVPTRVKDSIGGTTGRVKDRIGGMFGSASSTVGDVGGTAQEKMSSGMRSTATMARENPMGAFIGGVAAGLVLGLIVPKTRFEQERFGEQASSVMNQAVGKVAEMGHQAMDKEKEMLERAGDRATQTVERSGSTAGDSTSGGSSPTTGDSPWGTVS